MEQHELDAAIDALAEKIEIAEITNKVIGEKLDDLQFKLDMLEKNLRESE